MIPETVKKYVRNSIRLRRLRIDASTRYSAHTCSTYRVNANLSSCPTTNTSCIPRFSPRAPSNGSPIHRARAPPMIKRNAA